MTEPADFAPLLPEQTFARNLNIRVLRLAARFTTIFQRSTLRPAGVTVQEWRIFVTLARHGGTHLRALARKASLDASHASRVAAGMERKGWLVRSPDPEDQRLVRYAFSAEGRALFLALWPRAAALAREVEAQFPADDFSRMIEMVETALDHAGALLDAPVDALAPPLESPPGALAAGMGGG